eukprot:s2894_g8.t1
MQLVKDGAYWNERVHHPATAWLAMGARGVPTVATEAAVLSHLPGADELPETAGETEHVRNKRRQANQDKRKAQKKRKQAQREELLRLRAQSSKPDATNKGKSSGKGKSKDQAGQAICFSWASGTGPCGKLPPGAECVRQSSVRRWSTVAVWAVETDSLSTMAADAAGQSASSSGRTAVEAMETKSANIFVPERVVTRLEAAKSFAEFRSTRTFRFLHLYSGPKDVLAESLQEECERHQLNFRALSLDRKIDPELDLATPESRETLESEIVQCEFDYVHGGFPCNTFSRARWNEGKGPKPVRSAQEIYGLSSNSERQQQEADRGTVMATSTSNLVKKQCHSCKARGVPETATMENPPGDDRAGSAWMLPELVADLDELGGETVGNLEFDTIPRSTGKMSKKEIRQEENSVAIGGMRNPDIAVERLFMVREVGQKMREAWEEFVKAYPKVYDAARAYGTTKAQLDLEIRDAWRKRLLEVLGGDVEMEGITLRDEMEYVSPLCGPLWSAWQRASRDPDNAIPVFIRDGVPLGMEEKIPSSNGIFPEVTDSTFVEDVAPELEYMKDIQNYVSVTDQPEEAQIEIDRYKERGFVREISWEDAAQRFQCGTVSKLALILKTKPDMSIKRRIVIDLRRSKGNARSEVNERLILPRISDVLRSLRKMRSMEDQLRNEYESKGIRDHLDTEIYLVDFADAFCHYAVHRNELRHCLSPGVKPGQWLLWVALLFGYKSAPLLMARLSSAAGRFIQSMVRPWESMAQIYVDDLLLMVSGNRSGREHLLAMHIYTLSALGMMLSLHKGERGRHVVWIGTTIELSVDEVRFGVPKKMCEEILSALVTWPSRGMIPLKELRSTTGKLSWIAGILPRMRWTVSIFYAVIADCESDLLEDKEPARAASRSGDRREKPQLVAVKRLGAALQWTTAMILRCKDKVMLRREDLFETEIVLGIVTDASPLGLGAILVQKQQGAEKFSILEALEASVSYEEAEMLMVQHGSSSSQSIMEAFAILRALKRWQARLRGQQIMIRSDSAVALAMLRKLASPGVSMNFLGAEISLLLEDLDIPGLRLHHVAGKFNTETDYLSRPHERGELPATLKGVKLVKLAPWSQKDFTLPPPGAPRSEGGAKWQGTPTHHQSVWDFLA